ncbi:Ig-like domain-containing protein [Puerhibacterium sp. TATVAM-FAB25]|uniref:Ig-like domain-containing protein n=1 Tax=Puerhibacterium sp. TATVAM-FAB25 TaxID=3093699 RepID=UPI00397CC113
MASATAVGVLAASVVTLAVLSDGEATADVALNDSGVWVTKTSAGLLGRFNSEAQALDGTLLAGSSTFDVQQDAQRVLLTDSGASSASPVDPAHLELGGTLRAPADARVAAGAATVAVLDVEGRRLWVLPFAGVTAFDPEKADPVLTLEGRGTLTVARDGTVLVADPAAGVLHRVPTSANGAPTEPERGDLDVAPGAEVEVTAVGDDAVVLDRSAGRLVLPGGDAVDLADPGEARLQQPSAASDVVLVATTSGLVSQPLGGGDAQVRRASGLPGAPVQLGGCSYGAWAQSGQVVRDCAGTDHDVDRTLEGLGADSRLEYRVNRDVIVLNDLSAGTVWLAAEDYQKVDDWDQQIPEDAEGEETESEETTPEQVDQVVADRSRPNRPPQPEDDDLGVRAGRTTVLPVLANDVDPDGDVMTASVSAGAEGLDVRPVRGGAALQADVPPDTTGTHALRYAVSDGRGGVAEADVVVRVVPETENAPPEQSGEPVLRIAKGGTASIDVLPYFRDPDGDDLLLASAAATTPGDEVRARPDGTVELRDAGTSAGRKILTLSVADDRGAVVEGRLLVDVVATQEPPVPVNDHVVVLAGQATTVEPLANDSDPNGDPLRLASVAEQAPAEITPNHTAGTFRFVSDQPGSYDLTYQVSDGPSASVGLVRVDVLAPPDGAGAPVAVADQVLVPAGGSALVDVLANDTDPAGGVLVVQSVDVPADAGVSVAVLAHQVLRVTEVRRLEQPVTVTYTVSNGTATATGQLRVVPIPAPDRLRPPDAAPDEVTVHAGDVVTVPVLENDSHPDGLELSVAPELVESPDPALGQAFVAEDTVRFKAGTAAGTAYAVYEVADANGQKDSAQVTIHVVDGADNSPPQLPDVEARVLSGGVVRIVLPLEGTDPDGDSVMLEGIAGAPAKGTAAVVEGYVDYTAAPEAVGADSFTYRVTDARGASAVGTVRLGVARPPAANKPPVAVDDATHVRPGRTVTVDALANDSDPDGDPVGLVPGAVEGGAALDAEVHEGLVRLTTPGQEGLHTFYYGVEDSYAARATGAVTVDVDPQAPLRRPVARDDVVPPAAVTGDRATVDVLANDADPDGNAADLTVSVDAAARAAGVEVTASRSLEVPLTGHPQVLTYTVTDVDGQTASAFVRVPRDGQGPRLREPLPPLEVVTGEPLTLELADLVVVAEGRTPRLTAEDAVTAVSGTRQVQDVGTVVFTSEAGYVGPASVTFEVADGDPGVTGTRTAMLSVPITVVAPENLPPAFSGSPALEVASGEEAGIDVARFVTDPDGDPVTVTVTGDADGLTAGVQGTRVTVQADPSLPRGSEVSLPVAVSDGGHPPVEGRVAVTVVGSTRPLVRATEDRVEDAHQGRATTVPVLANDSNPFPDEPLTLTGATVETGRGTVRTDGDDVVVTPADDFVGVLVVRYGVQDATGDPEREVEGRVHVVVLGRPEAPPAPEVAEVRSETVVLTWDPPVDNGSPVTGYTVRGDDGRTQQCAATTCTVTGLTNDVTYRFTVTATNDVGESDPSPASAEARPDERPDPPAPPALEFGDRSLTITWTNRTYTDRSPIECVNLEISPAPRDGALQKTCLTGGSTTWTGLENGTAYRVRAQAVNAAPEPSDWGDYSAQEVPAGVPGTPGKPAVRATNSALGGEVAVSWSPVADNGAAVRYVVAAYRGSSRVAEQTVSGTSAAFRGLDVTSSYVFTVTARNKAGDSPASPRSDALVPSGTPAVPQGVRAEIVSGDSSGKARVTWTPLAGDDFRGPDGYYQVRREGGAWTTGGTPYTVTGLSNGTAYRFEVRACNAAACSGPSSPSGAVTPYTTPGAPSAYYSRTGPTSGQVVVTAGDDGGESVDRIEHQVNGGAWTRVDGTRATVGVGSGWGQANTVTARACNAAGCGPAQSASGTTDPNPDSLSVRIAQGTNAGDHPNCRVAEDCWWLQLHLDNAPPNQTVEYACWTTEPYSGRSPRQYEPAWSGFISGARQGGTITTDANGRVNGTELYCGFLSGGYDVWVVVKKFDGDGQDQVVESNRLRW